MGRNKFLVPIITGLIITLSLFLTIIVKGGREFEWGLLLAYLGIGTFGFAYSLILRLFKMFLASNLFLILSLLSGLYFYISMPKGPEALSQLGVFLGWIILMVVSLVLPLVLELILRFRKRNLKE